MLTISADWINPMIDRLNRTKRELSGEGIARNTGKRHKGHTERTRSAVASKMGGSREDIQAGKVVTSELKVRQKQQGNALQFDISVPELTDSKKGDLARQKAAMTFEKVARELGDDVRQWVRKVKTKKDRDRNKSGGDIKGQPKHEKTTEEIADRVMATMSKSDSWMASTNENGLKAYLQNANPEGYARILHESENVVVTETAHRKARKKAVTIATEELLADIERDVVNEVNNMLVNMFR